MTRVFEPAVVRSAMRRLKTDAVARIDRIRRLPSLPYSHLELANAFASHAASEQHLVMPVSIARVAEDTWILCDYTRLYRLRREGEAYEARSLPLPTGVTSFCPTGLAYDERTRLLYVAGYRESDIVSLAVQGEGYRLERRIVHDELIGPENLAVSSEGLFVADYDGSAILRMTHEGELVWRLPVPFAHGVAVAHGSVYATSLGTSEVLRLDFDGRVLGRAGGRGVTVGQYVWPVFVAQDGQGAVAVTDSVTGRVTLLDERLDTLRSFGGNGPGADLFNMPYAFTTEPYGHLVVDTFKRRVLRTTPHWDVTEQVVFGPDTPRGKRNPIWRGSPRAPDTFVSSDTGTLGRRLAIRAGSRLVAGHDSLDVVSGAGALWQRLKIGGPQIPTFRITWAVDAHVAGDVVHLIGSSQETWAWAVHRTGAWAMVPTTGDLWNVAGTLTKSSGEVIVPADIVEPWLPRFEALERMLGEGADAETAFAEALDAPDWDALIGASPEGVTFLREVRRRDIAAAEERHRAHFDRRYFAHLFELLGVRYLAGASRLHRQPQSAD